MSAAVLEFSGPARPLTDSDMRSVLQILGMDPVADLPLLWTVLAVESRGFGFLPDRRPKLLFERHIFHRETEGRFSTQAPKLSARTPGGYQGGGAEYERLAQALALCRSAGLGVEPALRSASWGLGQVMGFNAAVAGFEDAADMAAQMAAGEGAQLAGMANFMRSQGLERKLQARDWAGFAYGYNGRSYAVNQYHLKLRAAYEKFSSGVSRDLRARAVQGALLFLGYRPGDPDGIAGQNTRTALLAFRADTSMGTSEVLDDEVFDAIMRKAKWA